MSVLSIELPHEPSIHCLTSILYHNMAQDNTEKSTSSRDLKQEYKPIEIIELKCFNPWTEPYYLERGLRRVAPYHFTYKTYCKERWRGRGLLEIFSTEFRDRPKEYYVGGFVLSYFQFSWVNQLANNNTRF